MADATALTFADDDRELPPREVTGEHATRDVPGDADNPGYTQHFVGGVLVDPATVRPLTPTPPPV